VRNLFWLLPLYAACLWADEAADRAAIDQALSALNDPAQRAGLYTKEADSAVDFDHLLQLHRRYSAIMIGGAGGNEPWITLTVPRIVSGAIRFITTDVAMVDGASTIDGAVTLERRAPLLFVMKREGGQWKI
jgi:hypothetical protein